MKSKDNEDIKKNITFNDKLALFNNKLNLNHNNNNHRKTTVFNYSKNEDKPINNVEKNTQIFQPRRTIVGTTNQLNLNDPKKKEKRENKYSLKTEIEKNKENSKNKKINNKITNNENKKLEKSEIIKGNSKFEKKEIIEKKKDDIFFSKTNNDVLEKIKKLNEKEDKNKTIKLNNNNNNKGTIKYIEKINNLNNNDKKIKENDKNIVNNNFNKNDKKINNQENEKKIINNNFNKNKDNNNNIINNNIFIKEIQTKTKNCENKVLQNAHIFQSHKSKDNQKIFEQKNINNEKKKLNQNNNVKNFASLLETKLLNKTETNDNNKKTEGENNINQNINKNENNNNDKFIEINEFVNKKPSNTIYKLKTMVIQSNQKNNVLTQKNQNHNNNFNEIKRFSKQVNPNDLQNNNINKEIPLNKKEKIEGKSRSSKSLPKAHKDDNVNSCKYKLEYEVLRAIPIKEDSKTNSFCKAFFIVSFPEKNNTIIDKSEGIISDCGHEECSSLPGFEPEIIYKYPEKDSKDLELNNILASICFPNLIKVCYGEEEDKIYSSKNYSTCFTNQIGDRFYAIMFHFYNRVNMTDFCKKHSNFFEKLTNKYSGEIDESLDSKTELINNINKKKYVYIPYCFCLISKYPYFSQMEKCLQSMMLSLNISNIQNNEINEIITYLVNSVPSPYLHTSIAFPVPNSNNVIELNPCIYQEITLYGNNLVILLEKIQKQNILLLFRLLLLEQKILLVSSDYDNLAKISLGIISLLYPLPWIHIYIPILTEKMLKYLQSFLPFLNGMHRTLYEKEKVQDILFASHKDLYIFDIDKNSFEISTNLRDKKKTNPIKFLNRNVPSFPKKIEEFINQQLSILVQYHKKNPVNDSNILSLNIKMKLLFIQVFIEMLHDYKIYLTIIDDLPVFNINAYLNDKPEGDKYFYKELTSTQLYQIFIQNSLNYMNNKNKNYYFDELIEEYLSKKEKNDNKYNIILYNHFETKMNNHLFKKNKIYIINPSHLTLFKPIENQLNNPRGKKLLEDINHYMKKEFKNPLLLNENGILKENKRIVYNAINISNKNDIKELKYYMTKEEISENNENINNKEIDKDGGEKGVIENFINIDENNIINEIYDENQEKLTDLEKEDIRDNIRGTLTRVFKSEKVNKKKDTNVLLSSLEKDYGKNYFVNVIIGNKNSKEIKIISQDSFEILYEVISKCFSKLKVTKQNMIFVTKIIKSCSYFRAIVSKIEYLLDETIYENLTKNYSIFNEIFFWEFWIEEEIDKKDMEMYNHFKKMNKEKDTYYYIDEDDKAIVHYKENYKNLLKNAIKQMIKMDLNKSTILSVIESLCNKYLKDEDFRTEQVREIMDILKKAD